MLADLVSAQTRDGVRLDGTFRKPAQEQASQLGVDVVILHHGVGGNFYHPGMFDAYSDALLDVGCAVLRVNNRTRPCEPGAVWDIVRQWLAAV